MVCPKCGSESGEGDSHCSQCGSFLDQHAAASDTDVKLPVEMKGAWLLASSLFVGLAVDISLLRHDRGVNILIVGIVAMMVWAYPLFRNHLATPFISTSMFAATTVSMVFQSSGPADFSLYTIWGSALILYCVTCRDRLLGLEGSAIDTWSGKIRNVGPAVSRDIKEKTASTAGAANIKHIALGIGVALPIITILLILMESADMAFQLSLKKIFQNFEQVPGHIVWTLVVFIFMFYYTGSLSLAKKAEHKKTKSAGESFPLLSSIVVMISVAAVVAAFLYIHLKTLMLSEREIAKLTGMDYRSYIRAGFAELLVCEAIIGLTALFTLHTIDWKQRSKLAHRIVAWILLSLTACLSASCAARLWHYVDEYGLTLVRFSNCAGIAISFLSLLFMARLAARPMDFNRSAGVIFRISVFVFTIWSCAMPAKLISKVNAEKILEGKKVETYYLEYLGPDAFPALAKVLSAGIDKVHHTERDYVMSKVFESNMADAKRSLEKADFFETNPSNKPAVVAAESILKSIRRDRPMYEKYKPLENKNRGPESVRKSAGSANNSAF